MSVDELLSIGGSNLSVLEEMYQKFQENPSSVDPSWRQLLEDYDDTIDREAVTLHLESPSAATGKERAGDLRVADLIHAYRTYGHLLAKVNPILTHELEVPHELQLDTIGFSKEDLDKQLPTLGLMKRARAPLREIISVLQEIYCGHVGVEYMGMQMPEMEKWLQQHIEPTRFKLDLSIEDKKQILESLNKSDIFEGFLHTKYTGQKRFSLEGGETLIPILNAILEKGSGLGMKQFVLGMAHRGRLNVLCNILEKSYWEIFSEFEEGYVAMSFEGSGDVKYHKGFDVKRKTSSGEEIRVFLTPNPSHLEAVGPVVEGQVRAQQVQVGDSDGKDEVVPILIHGDAALAGQGVVYETMQLYRLPGYDNGGSIHVVINNQIGFTTLPKDARSTQYCTDIARTFGAPVFHVNAEHPEECVYATMLAVELRHRFHCDVFIELNCYRKYGHNEGDEPAFTQPLEYKLIRSKEPIRDKYRDELIQKGVLEREMAEEAEASFREELQQIKTRLDEEKQNNRKNTKKRDPEKRRDKWNPFAPVETAVELATLKKVAERFCSVPEGFHIHKKLQRLLKDRLAMVSKGKDTKPVDWGMGEHLAFATLLWEGDHVRLSGQDSRRGTFSHRHAMWMDQENGRKYFPLSRLKEGQGRFDVFNSPLSEYGVMGFEYGYSLADPSALVLWEAQFGDFCNGAQIIIDQFITSGEQKWNLHVPLTLLLPHGYEGQGPEHSSARIERFLLLCGDLNMQVVNPTSPAQLFHLLRRQVKMKANKPLIVFTPKGLLRHPECVNPLSDFAEGSFQEILDDPQAPKKPKRLAFCSGKVYYDLIKEREERGVKDLAILRVEQLYPLHLERIEELLAKYESAKKWYWVQEEPENMGPWKFLRHRLRGVLPGGADPIYVGREPSASPAAGSLELHKRQYAKMMDALFGDK